MITWILGTFFLIFCIVKRFSKDGRVEGYPLGMPKGTVRAIITIMVVSFPFNYLLINQAVPDVIINSIFILVAFYFEARKSGEEKLQIIREIKTPDKVKEEKKREKKPLYLPKYSVRISLLALLIIITITNILGPGLTFQTVNTIVDILTIIILYFIGSFLGSIGFLRTKKKLRKKIIEIPEYQTKSKYEILDLLAEEGLSWFTRSWRSFISIITFIAVTTSLVLFTINLDFTIPIFATQISLRSGLLLLINVYYGFRD